MMRPTKSDVMYYGFFVVIMIVPIVMGFAGLVLSVFLNEPRGFFLMFPLLGVFGITHFARSRYGCGLFGHDWGQAVQPPGVNDYRMCKQCGLSPGRSGG